MRTCPVILAFVVTLVGVGTAARVSSSPAFQSMTGDAFMGTWKLNDAKSKFDAGAAKNTVIVYVSAGESVKVTVDGKDAAGQPVHSEWTGKFDGKPYPVTGNPLADTRSYTRINEHTLSFAEKKGEKVTLSGRIVTASDGKSRTVDATATDSMGKKVMTHAVYDKQ